MPIDFSKVILDNDGAPVRGEKRLPDGGVEIVDLTVGRACANALTAPMQNEAGKLEEDDAINRMLLGRKIRNGGEHDLSIDEIALIKERIKMLYGSVDVIGEIITTIDPVGAKKIADRGVVARKPARPAAADGGPGGRPPPGARPGRPGVPN
jgi:hypothetical protein